MKESGANVPAMMDIISSGHGFSLVQRKALVYINADTLSTGPLGESGIKTACNYYDQLISIGAAYMCRWTELALLQVMVCRLFGAKPLPEPVLDYD